MAIDQADLNCGSSLPRTIGLTKMAIPVGVLPLALAFLRAERCAWAWSSVLVSLRYFDL